MRRNTKEINTVKEYIVNFSDFLQSLIFISSIVNTIMAPVIEKIEDVDFPDWINSYAAIFNTTSVEYLVNCIIMIFFIIKMIVVITGRSAKRNEEIIDVLDCIHTDYIHDVRNHIHQLEEMKEALLDINISKDIKLYEMLYNREYKTLQEVAQRCVNQVSEFINNWMGLPNYGPDSICVCIKMVSIYEKDKPISDRSLVTLARSRNSSSKRRKTKKDIIGKNSDFLDLSKGYRNFFYGINLKEKFEKGEYKNSTPGFSYESTVVVPIRFSDLHSNVNLWRSEKKKCKIEINITSDADIVGYLCIDSEKVFREWTRSNEVRKIVKILALYADSLYVYLSAFRNAFTIKKIGGKK